MAERQRDRDRVSPSQSSIIVILVLFKAQKSTFKCYDIIYVTYNRAFKRYWYRCIYIYFFFAVIINIISDNYGRIPASICVIISTSLNKPIDFSFASKSDIYETYTMFKYFKVLFMLDTNKYLFLFLIKKKNERNTAIR